MPDRVADLYEVLTTRRPLREKKRIDAACLDAIVATTDDPADAARFLTGVCTAKGRVPSMDRYEDALRRLGTAGNAAVLDALAAPELDAARARRLARLLMKISSVKPPEPLGRWLRGDAARRLEVVAQWRGLVADAGGLARPEPDDEEPWPDSPDPDADPEPVEGD